MPHLCVSNTIPYFSCIHVIETLLCVCLHMYVCVSVHMCVRVAAQVAYAIGYGYHPSMLSSYPGSGLNVSFLLIAHNNFTNIISVA